MNDSVVEVMIKRKLTVSTMAIRFVLALVTIISVFFATMHSIFWPFSVLAIMIVVFVYKKTNVEYEYTMINETIVIDKIVNQQKRKRVISFDIRKFDVIAPVGSEALTKYKNMKTLNCSSQDKKQKIYVGILKNSDSVTNVYLEPNERMLEIMRMIIGKKLYMN